MAEAWCMTWYGMVWYGMVEVCEGAHGNSINMKWTKQKNLNARMKEQNNVN
jgi:hypothetical protein